MPKIGVNGVEFYYELKGNGEPIVLISGYTGDHLNWSHIAARLAKRFRVLTFDNQGTGQTTDDGAPLSIEAMADNTVVLAKELGLTKFHVAGQSMGGSIVQMIALNHPDAIERAIISCSSPKWGTVVLDAFETALKLLEQGTPPDLVYDVVAPWCYGADFLSDTERAATRKREVLENPHPMSIANVRRQFEALKGFDVRSELERIKARALIISASDDIVATNAETMLLLEGISSATRREIRGGHSIPTEKPDEWIDCVMEFLQIV